MSENHPVVKAKIADAATLSTVRKLPFVDYVEPGLVPGSSVYRTAAGCTNWLCEGNSVFSETGDVIPDLYAAMGIPPAWKRGNGSGITIGLTDTGIYELSAQMVTHFNRGMNGQTVNRQAVYTHTPHYSTGFVDIYGCSHGTRMSGIMAAPRDGIGPIGVAWGSNLVSVRHNDDTGVFDPSDAMRAIDLAGQYNSAIIVMAWGSPNDWFNSIESTIEYWHSLGRLFIGAAGTVPSCSESYWAVKSYVIFPARMEEVLAVASMDRDGNVACDSHYGYDVDNMYPFGVQVGGYYNYATAGMSAYDETLYNMRGSSSATAAVAGAAAVIWSHYGSNRDHVVQKLKEGAANYPNVDSRLGYGLINVMKSVGGMTGTNVGGCTSTDCQFQYKVSSCTSKTFYASPTGGDGPFTYYWSNGSTGNSMTMTLCPRPGGIAVYSFNVSVTDADRLGNTVISKYVRIEVLDSSEPCPTCPQ